VDLGEQLTMHADRGHPPHVDRPPSPDTTWLLVDRDARTATLSGRPLDLRRKEFDLLVCLIDRTGRYVARREITGIVWGDSSHRCANSLNVHLSRLRTKFAERPENPVFLHSTRDEGVMFASHRTHTFQSHTELHVPLPRRLTIRSAA
jgi:DNA-binding response OmpR family regulator